MSFPTLAGKKFRKGNSDIYYATRWTKHLRGKGDFSQKSAYLDPVLGPTMHQTWAGEEGVDFMYGGYQENRSRILKGTYLDLTGGYVHQGIDYYVPAGTPVAIDHPGHVIGIDNDHPEEGGWGVRVMVKLSGVPYVLIFAHLGGRVHCRPGSDLKAGDLIGEVGAYPNNGGWPAEHLHLQRLSAFGYQRFKDDPLSVDGYGHPKDMMLLERLYPDPEPYFAL